MTTRLNMSLPQMIRPRLAQLSANRNGDNVWLLNDAMHFLDQCLNACAGGFALASLSEADRKYTVADMGCLRHAASLPHAGTRTPSTEPFFTECSSEPSVEEKRSQHLIRVEYSQEQEARLTAVQVRGGLAGLPELIMNALMLFMWAHREIEAGRQIVKVATKRWVAIDTLLVTLTV